MRVAAILAMLAATGCTTPTSPVNTCYTQPRYYYNPATGVGGYEIDHYTSETACPSTPIK